jgi:hypothetical protein
MMEHSLIWCIFSYEINKGLRIARQLLLDLVKYNDKKFCFEY